MKHKTIQINSETSQEVNLFLTQDDASETCVLIQAWHWFENKWFYQHENIYFDHEIREQFITDFSAESALAFVKDFQFSESK